MKCQWVYTILYQMSVAVQALEYTMAVNHGLIGKDGVF